MNSVHPQLPGIEKNEDSSQSFGHGLLKAIDTRKDRQHFITHQQVTGFTFLIHRIASGITLKDTRMLIDPIAEQTKPVKIGSLLAATALIGCLMFSFLKPVGSIGHGQIFSDRKTKSLYVKLDHQLYPVFNLTSAQLIIGKNDTPKEINSSIIDQQPLGNLIGIPAAPGRITQTFQSANWSVCQKIITNSRYIPWETILISKTQLPNAQQRLNRTHDHPSTIAQLHSPDALLVENHHLLWLITHNHRSLVFRRQPAIARALDITNAPIRPISDQLLNLIPRVSDLKVPTIAFRGTTPQYALQYSSQHGIKPPLTVGTILTVPHVDTVDQHYIVLTQGIQRITPFLAHVLNYSSATINRVIPADIISHLPLSSASSALDTTAFPSEQPRYIPSDKKPIMCLQWSKDHNDIPATITILMGESLPTPLGWLPHSSEGNGIAYGADITYFPAGKGYLAQLTGQETHSPREESLLWISDQGIKFPIPGALEVHNPTLNALGLHGPTTYIPVGIAQLLPTGPVLSRSNALRQFNQYNAPYSQSTIPARGFSDESSY